MDSFFGIGMMELFFIALIALIVLGPERMPGAIREVMKTIRYVRNLSNELTSQFSEEFKDLEDLNPQKILQEIAGDLDEEEGGKKTATTKPGAAKPAPKPAAAKPAPKTATQTPAKPAAPTTPTPKTTETTATVPAAKETEPAQTGTKTATVSGEQSENTILPPQAAMQEPSSSPDSPSPDADSQATEPVSSANSDKGAAPVESGPAGEIEPAPAARRAPLSVNGNSATAEGEG